MSQLPPDGAYGAPPRGPGGPYQQENGSNGSPPKQTALPRFERLSMTNLDPMHARTPGVRDSYWDTASSHRQATAGTPARSSWSLSEARDAPPVPGVEPTTSLHGSDGPHAYLPSSMPSFIREGMADAKRFLEPSTPTSPTKPKLPLTLVERRVQQHSIRFPMQTTPLSVPPALQCVLRPMTYSTVLRHLDQTYRHHTWRALASTILACLLLLTTVALVLVLIVSPDARNTSLGGLLFSVAFIGLIAMVSVGGRSMFLRKRREELQFAVSTLNQSTPDGPLDLARASTSSSFVSEAALDKTKQSGQTSLCMSDMADGTVCVWELDHLKAKNLFDMGAVEVRVTVSVPEGAWVPEPTSNFLSLPRPGRSATSSVAHLQSPHSSSYQSERTMNFGDGSVQSPRGPMGADRQGGRSSRVGSTPFALPGAGAPPLPPPDDRVTPEELLARLEAMDLQPSSPATGNSAAAPARPPRPPRPTRDTIFSAAAQANPADMANPEAASLGPGGTGKLLASQQRQSVRVLSMSAESRLSSLDAYAVPEHSTTKLLPPVPAHPPATQAGPRPNHGRAF